MDDFQIVPRLYIFQQNHGEMTLQFFMCISLNPPKRYMYHEMGTGGVCLLFQKCQMYSEFLIQYTSEFKSCVNFLSEIPWPFPIQQAALLGVPIFSPLSLHSSFTPKYGCRKLANSKAALRGWLLGSCTNESYRIGTQKLTRIFCCC